MENGKKLKIIDYKTSKKKFTKADLEAERQAMMYTLAAKSAWGRKKWPKAEKVVFNFLFLKPDLQEKGPIQEVEFSDDALKGFEAYVSSVFLLINNFTEDDAKANLPNTTANTGFAALQKVVGYALTTNLSNTMFFLTKTQVC